MKNYYLILLALAVCVAPHAFAQKANKPIKTPKIKPLGKSISITPESVKPANPKDTPKEFADTYENLTPKALPKSQANSAIGKETILGFTKYDLQTNASIGNRLARNSDGTMSAVWIYSNQTGSFPDRGTGYNYHDGSGWQLPPTARIENTRTGWPDIVTLEDGREMYICHHPDNDYLMKFDRSQIGSGSWSDEILTDVQPAGLWPRVASGGPDGNTVHVIAMTLPVTLDGIAHNGLNAALLYSRSTDGGETWDILNLTLPGADTNNYTGFEGDAYAIHARGNTVAIVDNSLFNGVTLWKSTDNGKTWERNWLLEPPIPKLDTEKDTVDPYLHGDATVNVLIDHDDMVHVFVGEMVIANNEKDEFYNPFPFTDGIFYWNESMGETLPFYWNGEFQEWGTPIARASWVDHNGNGFLDLPVVSDGSGNLFLDFEQLTDYVNKGLSSFPSSGIDDDGCIYLIFAALTDFSTEVSTQTGTEQHNFRHVYGIRSCDNGCTWSFPRDLTPNRYGDVLPEENVFGSLMREVDDSVRFIFQRDFTPGLHVQGEEHNATSNDVVYAAIPTTYLDTIPGACYYIPLGETEFCQGDSVLLEIDACASAYAWSTGDSTSSIWVKEHGQITVAVTTPCGVVNDTFDLEIPGEAPEISLNATVADVCNGDTATISVEGVGVASYMWSTGDTTSWIDVDTAGTYIVTVTNCGGSAVDSIVLPQPPVVEITSTGDCVGDTLAATEIVGATYMWSTTDTTPTITISEGGEHMVTVTLCGVSSEASYNADVKTLPLASESMNLESDTGVCFGNSITASAPAGYWYTWANGATTSSIKLNDTEHTGEVSVTISDGCGNSVVSDTHMVTIYPKPNMPTVTQDSGAFICSTTESEYKWFINGSEVSGVTTQKFTPIHWSQTDGADISVQTMNEHGCWSDVSGTVVNVEELKVKTTLFKLFPNPSNGNVSISLPNFVRDNYNISVKNILGETVYESTQFVRTQNLQIELDFAELEKGAYYLIVGNSQDKTSNLFILQ